MNKITESNEYYLEMNSIVHRLFQKFFRFAERGISHRNGQCELSFCVNGEDSKLQLD